MKNIKDIRHVLVATDWFTNGSVTVTFDGQWGSTGKGLMNSVLATTIDPELKKCIVTTNAGPNSGHTAYLKGDQKHILKQLPMFGIALHSLGSNAPIIQLNAGAIINPDVLKEEARKYPIAICVHPHAAVVRETDRHGDAHQIASTGQGVGPALIRKLERNSDKTSVIGQLHPDHIRDIGVSLDDVNNTHDFECPIIIEMAQGWGLGINSGTWPYTTSRECGVAQGLADAGVAPSRLHKSIMSLRTYPIRVGSTDKGSSGPCYHDQEELTWAQLGQEPEYTTVTYRERRVFTWSWKQFNNAVRGNMPDALFINFCNYIKPDCIREFLQKVYERYYRITRCDPDFVLLGFGPYSKNVYVLRYPAQVEQLIHGGCYDN